MRNFILVYINGTKHKIRGEKCFLMLADYLRYESQMCGTKIVCAEGDCGACSVLVHRSINHKLKKQKLSAINSCISMMAQLDGAHIVTVEGLKENNQLSEVQRSIVDNHGSQCGYCTPGFAIALHAFFQKPRNNLSPNKIKNCLTGNLCRCTGYLPLLEAGMRIDQSKISSLFDRFVQKSFLQKTNEAQSQSIRIQCEDKDFYCPLTLTDAIKFLQKFPQTKIISGLSDLGVIHNKKKNELTHLISLHLIPELYEIHQENDRIKVGARVVLSELRNFCKKSIPNFASFIDIFASPQIKNIATLVGNVANASPIGDTLPFLSVSNALVHTLGPNGKREVAFENFYLGYKKVNLNKNELITHVSFQIPEPSAKLQLFKVSKRKDLDISTVNAAMLFQFDRGKKIEVAKIAYGGVDEKIKRMTKTEEFLQDKRLDSTTINEAQRLITTEINPISDHRGSRAYRIALAHGMFKNFCDQCTQAHP